LQRDQGLVSSESSRLASNHGLHGFFTRAEMKSRKTTSIVLAALAILLGWSASVVVNAARYQIANSNVSHQMRGDAQSTSYPVILSHSILNSEGKPRIVLLHKLTEPVGPGDQPPFSWLDRLAIDPDGSKLQELQVRGEAIWVDPSRTQFFYATDGKPPHCSHGAVDCVSSFTAPEDVWITATSLQSRRIGEQ
jgi:hypothetical protein